jgi:hypothetical protein
MRRPTRKATAVLVLIVLLGGCATRQAVYQNKEIDFGSIRSVAILPLANLSKDQFAAERVRDIFSTMLLATEAVYVIPPGEVFRGISRANLADPVRPSSEELKRFAGAVPVDVVITGTVREYGEVRSGPAAANTISLSLQMLEVQTGKVVWASMTTRGRITVKDRLFGGGGDPLDVVTREAVEDLLDKLFGKNG